MSWSVSLCDPVSLEVAELDFPGYLSASGIFVPPSRREVWITVTSNYDDIYRREDVLGPLGLHKLDGMMALDSVSVLTKAIRSLHDDLRALDYWQPTEGNAKRPLLYMLNASKIFPSGLWEIV